MIADDCPHLLSLYASTAANDDGGGTTLAYGDGVTADNPIQTDVPCLINTTSGTVKSQLRQDQFVVRSRIGFRAEDLQTAPQRGWKAVAKDTGRTFILLGIQPGRESFTGNIPEFVYIEAEEWL